MIASAGEALEIEGFAGTRVYDELGRTLASDGAKIGHFRQL